MGIFSVTSGYHSPDRTSSPVEGVELDVLYDVLRNGRRRLVLHYLLASPGNAAELGPMATQVAAWENDEPVAAVTSAERKRVYNTLQQTHLPRLDDQGVVDYENNRGTVALCVDPKQLGLFLKHLPKTGTPWFLYTLAAGTLLWGLMTLNWVGVHVFGVLSRGTMAGLVGVGAALMLVLHAVFLLRLT